MNKKDFELLKKLKADRRLALKNLVYARIRDSKCNPCDIEEIVYGGSGDLPVFATGNKLYECSLKKTCDGNCSSIKLKQDVFDRKIQYEFAKIKVKCARENLFRNIFREIKGK